MIDVSKAFERAEFTCKTQATQAVRAMIENSDNPTEKASEVINNLFGVQYKFNDKRTAIHTTQYAVESSYHSGLMIDDVEYLISESEIKATKFRANPKYEFVFVEPEVTNDKYVEQSKAIEGIEITVDLRKDGSIKKGGIQILGHELYKTRVLTAAEPIQNQAIIDMFVKELGMSKPGATTYVGNCIKKFGYPVAGILKGKKGKQVLHTN